MKKLIQLSLLAVCCLGLFGCPYESQVPITTASIPVDVRMFGKWTCNDEVYNTYVVSKASETEYHILQQNLSNTTKFKGFLSEVKGHTFMNLYSDSLRVFYLYKVKLDAAGNRLTLLPLKKDLGDHFGSSEGLRAYVEKNANFQSFYDKSEESEFQRAETGAITIN